MVRQGGAGASGCAAVAILVGLGLLAAGGARVPVVRAERQTIDQLEAAVVMTFARFVEWSPLDFVSAASPIVVGVVAHEGVAEALEISSVAQPRV